MFFTREIAAKYANNAKILYNSIFERQRQVVSLCAEPEKPDIQICRF